MLASGGALAADTSGIDAMIQTYLDYRGVTAAGMQAALEAGLAQSITKALAAATAKAQSLTERGIGG